MVVLVSIPRFLSLFCWSCTRPQSCSKAPRRDLMRNATKCNQLASAYRWDQSRDDLHRQHSYFIPTYTVQAALGQIGAPQKLLFLRHCSFFFYPSSSTAKCSSKVRWLKSDFNCSSSATQASENRPIFRLLFVRLRQAQHCRPLHSVPEL